MISEIETSNLGEGTSVDEHEPAHRTGGELCVSTSPGSSIATIEGCINSSPAPEEAVSEIQTTLTVANTTEIGKLLTD